MSRKQAFLKQVSKTSTCWLWQGAPTSGGYGRFWFDGVRKLAHRAAYEIFKGDIPEDMCVCHKCDNPLCVNPKHLFLGTHSDNMRDMGNKGRHHAQNQTHCSRGHEFTLDNTWTSPTSGKRKCRTCQQMRYRKRYHGE